MISELEMPSKNLSVLKFLYPLEVAEAADSSHDEYKSLTKSSFHTNIITTKNKRNQNKTTKPNQMNQHLRLALFALLATIFALFVTMSSTASAQSSGVTGYDLHIYFL